VLKVTLGEGGFSAERWKGNHLISTAVEIKLGTVKMVNVLSRISTTYENVNVSLYITPWL
jgi:hypothetical protein